ncbi:MAG: glycosyltransferase [Candidatus Omnitrophica bacterium]|nr:glycosyltransferase [Candidatus Omnitrophota bacterium]MBD3269545.1 glycosyltransferase [Candidatus Omnitrophota bacterium]
MDKYLSIVVPVFNGAGNIEPLYSSVRDLFKKTDEPCELILVNDGSTDDTPLKLKSLKGEFLKTINLGINRGQHHAIDRGLKEARGRIILIMDDDQYGFLPYLSGILKPPPEDDLIIISRIGRNISFYRKAASKIINLGISCVTGKRIYDGGGIKIFSNKGKDILLEQGSFLRTLNYLGKLKIRQFGLPVSSGSRSRYNLSRLFRLFLQIVASLLGKSS